MTPAINDKIEHAHALMCETLPLHTKVSRRIVVETALDNLIGRLERRCHRAQASDKAYTRHALHGMETT